MNRFGLLTLMSVLLALPLGAQEATPKVVVLGFDGADADLAAQWMDEGLLPNLAKLRDEGTFRPLESTIPSQTPVSWSTFATGLSPGRHGIFDFLRRDAETYRPSLGLALKETIPFLWGDRNGLVIGIGGGVLALLLLFLILRLVRVPKMAALAVALVLAGGAAWGVSRAASTLLPETRPLAINPRQGATFWQALSEGGVRAKVVKLPQNFPPDPFEHGSILSGLGTPDLSFRIGKPFYFTSELFYQPRGGGDFSVEIAELPDNRGEMTTQIKGPPDELFSAPGKLRYLNLPMTLKVAEDRSRLTIEVSDQELSLAPGEWSDWVRFSFSYNKLIKIHGIGRFRLLELEPEIRLYLSPIQFDPTRLPPVLDISAPRSFAPKLAERFGLFKTIGWSIDTWSMDEGTIDEAIFMEDVEMTVAKEEEMLFGMLGDDDWDLLVSYFEFTDRVQHVMFRFFDPKHPLYDADMAAKWGGTILESYQRMDKIVGETLERMPEGAELMVVSDHGFASFRRGMNYNTWLAKNGYMTLVGEDNERKNLEDLFDQGDFFTNVDWSRTKAYALGLGNIYINLAGRESQGIVQPGEEYDALIKELRERLVEFVDPETGEFPVAYVFTRDEAHGVYDPLLMPDLIPSNNDGYRVGWQDSLGGIAKEVTEPNMKVWSGDHCSVYPPLVEGILFSTRKLPASKASVADIAPTLYQIYQHEPPFELDGKSLLASSAP